MAGAAPLAAGAFLLGVLVAFAVLSTSRPDVFHGVLLQLMGEAKPFPASSGAIHVLSYSGALRASGAGAPGGGQQPPVAYQPPPPASNSSEDAFFPGTGNQCPDFALFRPHLEERLRWWRPGSLRRRTIEAMPKLVARVQVVPEPAAASRWQRSTVTHPVAYADMPQRYEPVTAYMSIGDGYKYVDRPQATIRSFVRALDAAAAWDIWVPPVDLPLYPEDMPPPMSNLGLGEPPAINGVPLAPFFVPAESCLSFTVAVPDFSFEIWTENGIGEERGMPYPTLMAAILAEAAKTPYAERTKKALFRGQDWVDERKAVFNVLLAEPSLLDLVGSDTRSANRNTPLTSFSRWAVQLYIPGNGYSARFKYLLATGSPVVAYMGAHRGLMTEWWYPLLQPGVHYLPVSTPAEVREAVEWLLEHPDAAEAIGKAGQAFAATQLTQEKALCHWLYAARVYARKLAALPVLRDNAVRTGPASQVYERYDRQGQLAVSPEEVAAREAWNAVAGEEPDDARIL